MNWRAQLLLVVLAQSVFMAVAGSAESVDFFESRIRPVLVERCYKCHSEGAEKLRGGLRLDKRDVLLKGGASGKPAIVPGRPDESLLIEAIRYGNAELQMPPSREGGRLSDGQIADFVTWVQQGAVDPRTNEVASGISAPRADHWAFQPVMEPPLPVVKTKAAKTPIDAFVLAKLEAKGLTLSEQADKRTLIRRASYDLTGLPPTWEEVQSFCSDNSESAYEQLIDRLLASPHYGERWGRHWLDVARYSDTKGYVYDREEKRFVHSHVYRDWVVGAFNDDMPYDRFLRLQVAADQLVASNDWDLAALGFLTVGRRFLGVVHDIIDDRIDVLMRGTQGLSASCARCHDHKFDPIPTRDYYSLYGVFNSTSEKTVAVGSPGDDSAAYEAYAKGLRERVSKLEKSFQEKRAKKTDRLRAQVAQYLAAVLDVKKLPSEEFYTIMGPDDLNPVIVRQWDTYIHRCATNHRVFGPWRQLASLHNFNRDARAVLHELTSRPGPFNPLVVEALSNSPLASMRDVAERYGKLFKDVDTAWREALKKPEGERPEGLETGREELRRVLYGPDSPATVPDGAIVDIEWFFEEDARVELAKLQAEIDRWLLKAAGAPPHAVILADRPEPKNARVFLRGNPANKGEEVPRQYIELLSGPNRRPFAKGSGRLELAEAIAGAGNPLTARVMVNRVWLHHFGGGLVRTPSDFGTRCEPPSHPELLDWLARRFVEDGWSLKKLHKRIMLSATYQQRSDRADARAAQLDPENRLLWRMNRQRLDFESTRDSLLAVSGELDRRTGGKAAEMFAGKGTTRRTLYGYIDRQFVPALLRVFDFANPDLHIPQRPETTVPQQALYFMNSIFVTERARAVAEHLSAGPVQEKIAQLYRAAYQRQPTSRQVDLALKFLKDNEPARLIEGPKPAAPRWLYGFGQFDEAANRIKDFQALPHFTGEAWQGGSQWPDGKLGWLQLTAEGGHPGNDLQHAVIRRWVAPSNVVVDISGAIHHEPKEGDGIVARIVSSEKGTMGLWKLHAGMADVKLNAVDIRKGETVDFVVDIGGGLNSDQFKWSPSIKTAVAGAAIEWHAKKDFSGPPGATPEPLTAWEKYVQVVLQSNEFIFVD